MRSLVLLSLLALAAPALAAPGLMSHQGRAFDAAGDPVQGSQSVEVALFAADSGGSAVWTETQDVAFDDGYFALILGGTSPIDAGAFADTDDLWVELKIAGEALPRLRLTSVPWALAATTARNLEGGTVNATSIQINGTSVISGDGSIAWSSISGAPADMDTLATLGCSDGDVPVFNGSEWDCGQGGGDTFDASAIISGTVDINRIPVGTTDGTVAAGAHTHDAGDVTTGVFTIDRLPVGTTSTTVARGDHTHTGVTGSWSIGNSTAPCNSSTAGAIRFTGSAFEGCTGSAWTSLSIQPNAPGSSLSNPGTSCKALKAANSALTDGIYWVDGDGGSPNNAIPVFCDMTTAGGGWMLVYKQSSGVATDPSDTWNGGNTNVFDQSMLNRAKNGDYANPFTAGWWTGGAFTEARAEVITGSNINKAIVFNATSQTSTGWYAAARIASSPWSDLTTASATNFFGIAGDASYNRDWFINFQYGGCPADIGWVVVKGNAPNPCAWEYGPSNNAAASNVILYASGTTRTNWVNTPTVGVADVFAVFVR